MKCSSCSSRTRVVETRTAPGGTAVRRRRECLSCGRRFTTFERAEHAPMYVVKRGGERVPFNRDKLRRALLGAAHKRPVNSAEIDRIVNRIESRIEDAGGEISSQAIADLVLEDLQKIDVGAYMQFAGTLPDVNPEIATSAPASSVRDEEDGS